MEACITAALTTTIAEQTGLMNRDERYKAEKKKSYARREHSQLYCRSKLMERREEW